MRHKRGARSSENETAAPAGPRNGGENQKLAKTSTHEITHPGQTAQGVGPGAAAWHWQPGLLRRASK